MKITTKGRYALRMLIDLAENQNGKYISLKEISQRHNISKKYLEQIIPALNKRDYLLANRGSRGGYMLARNPDEYTVGEILRLTEGPLSPADWTDGADNDTLPVWHGLFRVINEYLDGITLQDILDQQPDRQKKTM